MADEDVVNDVAPSAPPEEESGPGPSLSLEDKKRLGGIIMRMQAAKVPEGDIGIVVKHFTEKYGQASSPLPAQPDYRQPVQQAAPTEASTSPVNKIQTRMGTNFNQDPTTIARQTRYLDMRDQAGRKPAVDQRRNRAGFAEAGGAAIDHGFEIGMIDRTHQLGRFRNGIHQGRFLPR